MGYRSVAYFVNWAIYGRKYRPQELPADKLTHVLYSFGNIRPESGEVYLTDTWADTDIRWADSGDSWNDVGTNLYGCLKQLNLLKHRNRNLKILLSIGGWTYSSSFTTPASTAAGREKFAQSAVELIKNYGFDGLDTDFILVDWEYPKSPTEAEHLVLLLKACRDAMDTYSRTLPTAYHLELTVACPVGAQNYNNMDLPGMDQYLDFWNLMAYDYAGSWESTAGHQANLFPSRQTPSTTPFNTADAVNHYRSKNISGSKIVVGMPLYGRAFENTDGLGKPYHGVGEGTWEAGVYDFKKLPLAGATEHYDAEAGASYSYDPAKRQLITYDTVDMARRKADWIKSQGLGGGMWWESSADNSGESLIGTVVATFGCLEQSPNCVEYPQSKYDNLKSGFAA
ncbi:glycoside hydrolase family 18 protein [Calycina marina]|uniref:chitinase n=1 Tax=Calycina marina TaxID=1763456 RepID=A0A9P7YX51_9HELO|nr:glycoside hydrolase family 18 protein [Calycina marina]